MAVEERRFCVRFPLVKKSVHTCVHNIFTSSHGVAKIHTFSWDDAVPGAGFEPA